MKIIKLLVNVSSQFAELLYLSFPMVCSQEYLKPVKSFLFIKKDLKYRVLIISRILKRLVYDHLYNFLEM